MTEFGAVMISEPITHAFWGRINRLIGENPERLPITAEGLEVVSVGAGIQVVMEAFDGWLSEMCGKDNPRFISDNPAYDWQWVNHAFWTTIGRNPFGHSATNQGSLYKGMVGDMKKNFKYLRVQKHTHNPVDDALGNAQAFLKMREAGLRCAI